MSGGLSAAEDVDISDVTSDSVNARILRQLKNDDPEFTVLRVYGSYDGRRSYQYAIEDARSMGALGYYLGRCTNVTTLTLSLPEDMDSGIIEPFLAGLERNRSIKKVRLWSSHIPRDFFRMLMPFIRDNPNLVRFHVRGIEMDAEQYHSLSSALREGNSLKDFFICVPGGLAVDDEDSIEESIVANIEALKMHPRLEKIHFQSFPLGRNACAVLSDLLRHSARLQKIVLWDNGIDDAGVEALVDSLAHCRGLREFYLPQNSRITVRGWRALSTVLEDPNSSLKQLHIWGNGINDEIATMFANALARNNTLEVLNLDCNMAIAGEGWKEAFAKVLCDTSSVNNTFHSNHTLQYLTAQGRAVGASLPIDIASLLALNEEEDKQAVAIRKILLHHKYYIRSLLRLNRESDKRRVAVRKILLHHDDFDMQPLFDWDLKVLPVVIDWLERAADYEVECEAYSRKRKLSAIYQFVRGMPELAVDGILGVNKKPAKTGGAKRLHSTAFEG